MEVTRILDLKESGRIYGLFGDIRLTTNHSKTGIITDYKFNGTVKEYLNNKKAESSLKIVMLTEDYLDKKSNELSESDLKKVNLAKCLAENKDNIVLDFFEKGLNDKEKQNFKRLFKKLTEDIHKTILIYTNNLEFLWDIADSIIHVENNNFKTYKKSEYFELSDLMNSPEITRFIKLMREKEIKIEDYKDVKDLLKAIYRIKEQEK